MNHFDGSAAYLDHLCLQSDAPDRLKDFYGETMGYVFRPSGERYIGLGPQRRLIIERGKPKTLSYAAFAVDSAASLHRISVTLQSSGISFESSPSPVFSSAAFAVRDPDNNLLVFGIRPQDEDDQATDMTPAQPPSSLRNAGDDDTRPIACLPGRMQHVVVATRDLPAMMEFYSQTLKFGIADTVRDDDGEPSACFFYSDSEHHSFAAFRAPQSRLDHHAYETGSWDLIRDWADHFARFNRTVMWGPGRHGVGNNLFAMFEDPDGNWIEVSAELEKITPNRPVGEWRHGERALNLWGRAILRS